MRSRITNILQVIVLLTGIIYITVGLIFFVSPLTVLELFAQNVSENWLDLVRDNELVGPLYYLLRGFSALMFTSGAAMVMPLYDPLKYRGLIYYNGIIFPFLASSLFLYNSISSVSKDNRILADTGKMASNDVIGSGFHMPVLILGITLTVILILTIVGLLLTKKQAYDGIE